MERRRSLSAAADAALVCLKSYGDLVIARGAVARMDTAVAGVAPTMVIGSHLRELFDALGEYPGACVEISSSQVPALFDVKKRGVASALRDALDIRARLGRLKELRERELVFDRLGPRERFIAGSHRVQGLPHASNIYDAFEQYLNRTGLAPRLLVEGPRRRDVSVGIFPSSRVAAKNLPDVLVRACVASSTAHRLRPSILLLEGEREDLEAASEHVTVLPRGFATLVEAVRSVDIVLSADSLPAHLGEYFGRAVFVLTRVDNAYWLPRDAHVHHRWAKFDELTTSTARLDRFLSTRQHGIENPGLNR